MSYIGNTVQNQSFVPTVDYFSGDGSTVAFTLSHQVGSVYELEVVVNNVQQNPSSAYTVSGSTITFTSAPSSGSNNIYVYYVSPNTQIVQPGQGTVGTVQIANGSVTNTKTDTANLDGTGAMTLPSGTTAQRPGTPINGQLRYNSTTGYVEMYESGSWNTIAYTYSIDYLVVAGGGGGSAGGGGAGGYTAVAGYLANAGSSFTVTVGSGGAYNNGSVGQGANGGTSSFGALTSTTGGGGGGMFSNSNGNAGNAGGSGGGNGGADNSQPLAGGGAGTSGQGYAGGQGVALSTYQGRGGGGGAGAVGNDASGQTGGNGGIGKQWLNGTYYAGGGGGGSGNGTQASGGSGGGGQGGAGGANAVSGGTANTGGGGGAGGSIAATNGANGGSGVVIVRYAGSQRGTGGTVTSSGGYTYHTFTTSGTFTA